jgi:hypothetical protein
MKIIMVMMVLLVPSLAQALSCITPSPFSNSIFFYGKVLEVKTTGIQGGCNRHYKIQVEKNWHGAKEGDIVEVDQEVWMCGRAEVSLNSQEYFALTPDKNGKFFEGMCGGITFQPYQENGELVPKFSARLKALKTDPKP